jgi:hypothetical protein
MTTGRRFLRKNARAIQAGIEDFCMAASDRPRHKDEIEITPAM